MELTGRHVLAITCSAFAVIISVNMVLAYKAVTTFPGLEVKNSYVASQKFDAERAAQEALGWQAGVALESDALVLTITDTAGAPAEAGAVSAVVGRPTTQAQDRVPEFVFDGAAYRAPLDLAKGYWTVKVSAQAADGTPFRQRLELHVR